MEIFSRLCYNHRQINFLRPAAAKSGSNREGKEAQHVIDHQNENLQPNENEQDTTMIYFNPELMQSIANVTARKRESFREMQAAAEDGDLDAEYRLALSYANGEDGAPEDEEKAFYWFSKAADGDHIGAQFNLGLCYARGEGTEKDYDKAVLVGTTTFGKGIVQSIYPFDDGTAMKITISEYYTPSGANIHGTGIEPDVAEKKKKSEDGTRDNQLDRAKEILAGEMRRAEGR